MQFSIVRLVALVAACAGLLACGCGPIPLLIGGTWVGVSDALNAGGGTVLLGGENTRPVVQLESPARVVGDVPVAFTLADANSDPLTVTVEFSTDDEATWRATSASAGNTFDAANNAAKTAVSDAKGRSYTFLWDAVADLAGSHAVKNVKVRVGAADPGFPPERKTSPAFIHGNDPPAISADPLPPQSGNVAVTCRLLDSTSDLVSIDNPEIDVGDGLGFRPASPATGIVTTSLRAAPAPNGELWTFVWNSKQEQVAGGIYPAVQFRLTPKDAYGAVGAALVVGPFSLDTTKYLPVVLFEPVAKTSGDVTISYKLIDAESKKVDVVAVDYSADNGASWKAATPASAPLSPLTDLDSSPSGSTHVFTWNAVADLGGTLRVRGLRVRVTAKNTSGTAQPQQTALFDHGNDPPSAKIDPVARRFDFVTISYWLSDAAAGTASIVPEYSTDQGASWKPAAERSGAGSEGKTALSTSASPGTRHTFVWDAAADLGGTSTKAGLLVRITPSSEAAGTGEAAGQPAVSTSFTFGNTKPVITFPSLTGTKSGGVLLPFSVQDAEADPVYVDVRFSLDGGVSWLAARESADIITGKRLPTQVSGQSYLFVWDSPAPTDSTKPDAPQGVGVANTTVKVRIQAVDSPAPGSSPTFAAPGDGSLAAAEQKADFTVNNSGLSSSAVVIAPSGGFHQGTIPIRFQLAADPNSEVTAQVEYTTNPTAAAPVWKVASLTSGPVWNPATSKFENGVGVNALKAKDGLGATLSHDVFWDTHADGLIGEKEVRVRVTPWTTSFALAGQGGESKTFAVLNGVLANETWRWRARAPMPTARSELGAATVNNIIYAIGGRVGDGSVKSAVVEAYDPATNSWTTKQPMPTARDSLAVVPMNGKIYAIGGNGGGVAASSIVEEYDPSNNTWSAKANLLSGRNQFTAVYAGAGKILVCGGVNSTSAAMRDVELYDPVTGGVSKANLPIEVYAHASFASGDRVLVVGRRAGSPLFVGDVYEYDPNANSWSQKQAMPTARGYLSAAVIGGKAFAIGGWAPDWSPLPTVEAYDWAANSWTTHAPLGKARAGLATAVVNGKIYAIGGVNSGVQLDTVEEYGLSQDFAAATANAPSPWATKAPMQTGRYQLAAAATNGVIYAIGGYNNSSGQVAAVEEYNPANNSWVARQSLPAGRQELGAVAVGAKVYVVGGAVGATLPAAILEYDPASNTWTEKEAMPGGGRYALGVAQSDHLIYAIGGPYENRVQQYNPPPANSWAPMAVMPTSRGYLTAAKVGRKIYAIGGRKSDGLALTTVEELDAPGNTWTTKAPMPTARGNLAAEVGNGKVYVFGGWSDTAPLATVEEYDPVTNTWAFKTAMPTARGNLAAAVVNDRVYLLGGSGLTGAAGTTVEEYTPALDVANGTGVSSPGWLKRAPMVTARAGLGVAAAEGKIYAVTGAGVGYSQAVEQYDPTTDAWATKKSISTARYRPGVAELNGMVYVIGGEVGSSGNYTNTVEAYNALTDSWNNRKDMSVARYGLAAVSVGGKVFAIGGQNVAREWVGIVEEYDPSTDSWTNKTSMKTGRAEVAAAVVNGKIYVMGGWNGATLPAVEEYDPATDIWTNKKGLPRTLKAPAAAVVRGRIYVLGGRSDGGNAFRTAVEEYDPSTDSWTDKALMPTARDSLGAVAVNGKIYVIGGDNGTNLATVEEYDPASDAWSTVSQMVTGRRYMAAAVADKKVYTLGGYGSGYSNNVEIFNPADGSWNATVMLPAGGRSGLGAASLGGDVYAIGGFNGSTAIDTVEKYNPSASAWASPLPPVLPAARKDMPAAEVNDRIYVIGGSDSSGSLALVEEFDPTANGGQGRWSTKTPMPTARQAFRTAVVNGKIYAMGGYNGSQSAIAAGAASRVATVEEFDPTGNGGAGAWTVKASMPTAREHLAAAAANGRVYAIGGSDGSRALATVEMYDPVANAWTPRPALRVARMGHAAAATSGKIYVFGGFNYWGYDNTSNFDSVEVLDPAPCPAMPAALSNKDGVGVAVAIGLSHAAACADDTGVWFAGGFSGADPGVAQTAVYRYNLLDGTLSSTGVLTPTSPYRANTWAKKSDLSAPGPGARGGLALLSSGGNLYAVGGATARDGTGATGAVDVYNVSGNNWSAGAALPTARGFFGFAVSGGKGYAIGGKTGALPADVTGAVEELDPAANAGAGAWVVKTSMPTPRAYVASSAGVGLGGEAVIYCAGGKDTVGAISPKVERFNPATNAWSVVADLPAALFDGALSTAGGGLFFIGGRDGAGPVKTVYQYNVDSDTWQRRADLETALSAAAYATGKWGTFITGGVSKADGTLSSDHLLFNAR
ncbi:MAG: hypothetical protein HY719_11485 [Planctomycetes bacterium]|nr:hypothetical protein [Planctomycetota bacterium]